MTTPSRSIYMDQSIDASWESILTVARDLSPTRYESGRRGTRISDHVPLHLQYQEFAQSELAQR